MGQRGSKGLRRLKFWIPWFLKKLPAGTRMDVGNLKIETPESSQGTGKKSTMSNKNTMNQKIPKKNSKTTKERPLIFSPKKRPPTSATSLQKQEKPKKSTPL